MKNILIYINDSLGELDWIAPFMKSQEAKNFNFHIFLNGPGNSYKKKLDIIKQYGLNKKNIILINSKSDIDVYVYKVDVFLNRVLGRSKRYSFLLFQILRTIFDKIRGIFPYIFFRTSISYDFIFRDYNLKDSFMLKKYERNSKKTKNVIFPHAVGLSRMHPSCPREPIKEVACDLWLENSELSDIVKKHASYKDVFFASGAPIFDVNYKLDSLFNTDIKKVLIITRDCNPMFGFNYGDAYNVFEKLLSSLNDMKYTVLIKHHPRDKRLSKWRNIQNKYKNTIEYEESLNNMDEPLSACFTLFSTAPLLLLSRQIPIFDISPYRTYKSYKKSLPFHYSAKNGVLTHDLIELKLYERLDDLEDLGKYMHQHVLEKLSFLQYSKCKEIFPDGANLKIANKLLEVRGE